MRKILSSIFILALVAFSFKPASAQNDVTFTVDMTDYVGSFTTVYIAGSFNSWTDANPLTDMGNGIWSGVISLADGTYECKFMVDNWADDETFSGSEPCTTGPGEFVNRIFTVSGAPLAVGPFCWGSCDACGVGPANGSVTFTVDMSDYMDMFTTVYIAGTFNGWSDANPLTDMGNGLWSGTVVLPGGDNEYKFMLDNWNAEETFNGSEPCTTPPAEFVNRVISVDGDATAPTVCFNSCEACGSGPASGSITFSVDMSEYTEMFTTVYIGGTFNGWSDANPLTDMGNGIWEGTVTMPGGDNEYKFMLDNWNAEETFDGSESCTTAPAEFVNRVVSVDGNGSVATVCFNSCDACSTVGTVNILRNNELFTVQPTLVDQFTSLQFHMNGADRQLTVYNAMGQIFTNEVINQSVTTFEINTSSLANGVYFINVQMENDVQIQKIMVNH